MDTVSFPARLVVSRLGWQYNPPAKVIVDPTPIENDQDLAKALHFYRDLAENGGMPYTLTLAALADVDRVVAEREAEHAELLTFGKSPATEPTPEPAPVATEDPTPADPLDLAYQVARATFAGDPGSLARLERAFAIAGRPRGVRSIGKGEYWVTSGGWRYTVNGRCNCADYRKRGVRWCKHRLAVALVRKAEAIEKERAEGASNTPGPVVPPGPETQAHYTTAELQTQAAAIVAEARGLALVGPWTRAAIEVTTAEAIYTVINVALGQAVTDLATRGGWRWQKSCRRWISPAAAA